MEKIISFVLSAAIAAINIILSYYAVGMIFSHWNLYHIIKDVYDINLFFCLFFVVAILRVSTTVKVDVIKSEIVKKKKDSNFKNKESLVTTMSIILITALSYLISLIIM